VRGLGLGLLRLGLLSLAPCVVHIRRAEPVAQSLVTPLFRFVWYQGSIQSALSRQQSTYMLGASVSRTTASSPLSTENSKRDLATEITRSATGPPVGNANYVTDSARLVISGFFNPLVIFLRFPFVLSVPFSSDSSFLPFLSGSCTRACCLCLVHINTPKLPLRAELETESTQTTVFSLHTAVHHQHHRTGRDHDSPVCLAHPPSGPDRLTNTQSGHCSMRRTPM
jgi:hypothetical protein